MLDFIELSRLQFAFTAMYHFIFVPLTLGMSFLLAVMETVYVVTGKQIYRDMTKYWGKLFGINFALGVATGLTMEFQFGTNWAIYSSYVGDIFGAPLAIEGLMAFFLESTLVGLFFFGWDRMKKGQHLAVTWLVALGSNLSALWILIANGWMQHPVGATFNYHTMRMEMVSFSQVLFNIDAQVKFLHTVTAGYTTGAVFVLGVSSYFLLKKRDLSFAKRSFAIAAMFGLAVSFAVMVLGDESGYQLGNVQKTKLAAIEAEWNTQPAPADFVAIAWPNQKEMRNDYAVKVPYLLGIIARRSLSKQVTGINDIIKENEQHIKSGLIAFEALRKLRKGDNDPQVLQTFNAHKTDLGYGRILEPYIEKTGIDPSKISDAKIAQTAKNMIPEVAPLFWAFRIMVGCGLAMFALIIYAVYLVLSDKIGKKAWFNRCMLYAIPLPWIAAECGWFVSEYGRQPWAVDGVLPTSIAASNLTVGDLWTSLIVIGGLYTVFLIVEVKLMFKYAKLGPSSLKTGRYHFEQIESADRDQK